MTLLRRRWGGGARGGSGPPSSSSYVTGHSRRHSGFVHQFSLFLRYSIDNILCDDAVAIFRGMEHSAVLVGEEAAGNLKSEVLLGIIVRRRIIDTAFYNIVCNSA